MKRRRFAFAALAPLTLGAWACGSHDAGPSAVEAPAEEPVAVADAVEADDETCDEATFTFFADGAQQVWVTGTFTTPAWASASEGAWPMREVAPGLWSLAAHFSTRGHHLYKLLVDDQPAVPDPLDPEQEPGGSVVNRFRVFAYPVCTGSELAVTGTFTTPAWSASGQPLGYAFVGREGAYDMQAYQLPAGTSLYKVIVGTDPFWATDPYNPLSVPDGAGDESHASVVHVCHE